MERLRDQWRNPCPLCAGPNLNTMGKFGTYKRLETLLEAPDLVREDPALPVSAWKLVAAITQARQAIWPPYKPRVKTMRASNS